MKKYSHLYTLIEQVKLIKKNKLSKMYFFYLVNAICLGAVPVISAFFSKVIIEAVTNATTIEALVFSIVILIALTTFLYTIGTILSTYLEGHFLQMRQIEFHKIIELYRNIDYEYIENKEYQDKFEMATSALDGDGQGFQHTYNMFNLLFRGLISILLFFILLALFNFWIALICLASTILTTLLNRSITQYQMKRKKEFFRICQNGGFI